MRLAKMLQASSRGSSTSSFTCPQTFLGFLAWMGVTPKPGQRVLVAVAYDGVQPKDLVGEEREIARRIFGDVEAVTPAQRAVIAAVCGARGGKSYLLIALRLLWGMLVRDLSSLAPGQRAVALLIAQNDKLRREVVRYALGAVQSKPELAALLVGEPTADGFRLRRPDGQLVAFETGVATAGGYGARGRSLTDFAMDEAAFFRDASFAVNDEEIFRAGSARVLPGGQTIVASTPWAEAGLLYDLWKRNFGKPEDALVAHAPTLVVHDSEMTRAIVAREEARDPDNARREFGAEFMTGGTTVFFEGSTLDAAETHPPEWFGLTPGDRVAAGADFGFRSDSSSLILAAHRDGLVHVYGGAEKKPEQGVPLKPSVTVRDFARLIDGECSWVMADGHYRESISEHLDEHGLSYLAAPSTPADTYVRARMLLREGRIRIHGVEFRTRLLQQLREVQGRPIAGGGMSIIHPRWAKGGHGDLAAAFVLALWQLWGEELPKRPPKPGTHEHEMAMKRERAERFKQEEEAPFWRSPAHRR